MIKGLVKVISKRASDELHRDADLEGTSEAACKYRWYKTDPGVQHRDQPRP